MEYKKDGKTLVVLDKFTNERFKLMCSLPVKTLEEFIIEQLKLSSYEPVREDGYIYAKGDMPYLLVAHLDTVHRIYNKDFIEFYDKSKNQHIMFSPQGIGGDDRCGVYMILEIIKQFRCSVLFTEDEEVGCIGARKFILNRTLIEQVKDKIKFMIELDRKGEKDAVFYDCDNDAFKKLITSDTPFIYTKGRSSDVKVISPVVDLASVNLSCGYYNPHRLEEYVVLQEMYNTIDVVKSILAKVEKTFVKTRYAHCYKEQTKSNYTKTVTTTYQSAMENIYKGKTARRTNFSNFYVYKNDYGKPCSSLFGYENYYIPTENDITGSWTVY